MFIYVLKTAHCIRKEFALSLHIKMLQTRTTNHSDVRKITLIDFVRHIPRLTPAKLAFPREILR